MERQGYMAIDQYGETYHMPGVKYPRQWLLNHLGRQHCAKMYEDNAKTGEARHIGYVIAGLWLTIYQVFPMHDEEKK